MAAIYEGLRFDHLTVQWQIRPHGYWMWVCLCDCGKTVWATHRELEDGEVSSGEVCRGTAPSVHLAQQHLAHPLA